jgi:hypothetical protein
MCSGFIAYVWRTLSGGKEKSMEAERRQKLCALLLHDEEVHAEVSRVAYKLFLERGGAHGYDIDDWLKASESVLISVIEGLRQELVEERQRRITQENYDFWRMEIGQIGE